MSAPADTDDRLAGVTVGELAPGDVAVLDPIYGMERVLTVMTLYITADPERAPASLGQPWPVRKLKLRDSYGNPRHVLRFPQEPCVRVRTDQPLAGEKGAPDA